MFRNKLCAAVLTIVSAAALAVPASAFATNPLVWRTNQGSSLTGQPMNNQTYTLSDWNRMVRSYGPNGSYGDTGQDLVYGHQTWGVDLQWYTPTYSELLNDAGHGWQWQFVRQSGHFGHQISGTERVAIYNTATRRYLADGHETFGVDVVWSSSPRFEWQVATGERDNTTYGGSFTELYNTTEQAYLLDGHQTWGVDVRWLHAPFSLPYGYTAPQTPWQRVGPGSAGAYRAAQ
jgi:hypothetical protein